MTMYIINDTIELDRKELEDFLFDFLTENELPLNEIPYIYQDNIRRGVRASAFRIMRYLVKQGYFTSIICYDSAHTTEYRGEAV